MVRKCHRSRLFRVPGALTPQGNVGGDAGSNQAAALLYGGGDLPPAVAEDPPGSPSPLRLWLRCRRLRRPCGRYSAAYTTYLRPVPVRERARRPGRRRHSGDRRRPHSIDLREDASRCGQRDDDANLPNTLRLHGTLGLLASLGGHAGCQGANPAAAVLLGIRNIQRAAAEDTSDSRGHLRLVLRDCGLRRSGGVDCARLLAYIWPL
nr:uncharacterized protein LOC129381723 [Dermacentor andersoni]